MDSNHNLIPKSPLVSILISIHNGVETLDACLRSVKKQTYKNYELIIIDDASTDATGQLLQEWIKKFKQPITVSTNKQNLGLTKSLNKGLRKAAGQLVARLDVDDTWSPDKLRQQVTFLEKHPAVGIVGSWYYNMSGKRKTLVKLPASNSVIRQKMFRQNPFGHSCVLVKKHLLNQVGGYDETIRYGQDRDLWFRLRPLTSFANIEHPLCTRSADPLKASTNIKDQMKQGIKTRLKYLTKYRAPLYEYLYVIEPAIVMMIPNQLRRLYRSQKGDQSTEPRILFINDRFFPSRRAEAVARVNMARALSRAGNHITFRYLSKPNRPKPFITKQAELEPVYGLYVSNENPLGKIWNTITTNVSIIRASFLFKPQHYDIIFLRSGAIASFFATLRNSIVKRPLIIEVHNFHFKHSHLADILYRYAFNRAAALVTINAETKANWKKHTSQEKILVRPSGTDITTFKEIIANKQQLRRELDLPINKRVLVYTGHLYRDRGIENIIGAAHKLADQNNLLFYLVGGNPEDVEFYQQYVKQQHPLINNIVFAGYQPPESIPKYLKAADISLVTYSASCPTINTMSPMKLSESMASKTPIIAADFPRIRDLVDEQHVVFYQPDNTDSLTDAIKQVVSNYDQASLKATKAYYAVKNKDWITRAKSILNSAA